MKTKKLLLICAVGIMQCLVAQNSASYSSLTIDQKQQADEQKAREFFTQHNFNSKDYDEYITSWRKEYKNLSQKINQQPALPASPMAACTNIDFEQGTLNGWAQSTGYHPLYNPLGCCLTLGGAQAITTGAGLDPFGLFPVVCPGGSNSLQLGNSAIGGIADRIEQTFLVTSSNNNYSYKYAVVLEDPGHPTSQQPAFTVEMFDSSGNQIPCTYYDVAAGQGISGFQNSTVQSDVVFKPWTTVSTSPFSYNVTSVQAPAASFTTTNQSCNNQITYTNTSVGTGLTSFWNFGDGATSTTNAPTHIYSGVGTYANTLIEYSTNGCSDTSLQNITIFPKPNAAFIFNQACATNTVNFSNNSTVNGGTIVSSRWAFGDGTTSLLVSPTHIYAVGGNYNVQLAVIDNNTCKDSLVKVTAIYNLPIAGFNATTVCEGNNTVFNNTSTVVGSTISNYAWDFTSDGINDNITQNPSNIYPASGTYSVMLQVTSAQGCVNTVTNTVVVNPNPIVLFSVANACTGSNFTFNNNSSVVNGSITQSNWSFGDGTNSSQNAPQHTYSPAGSYVVTLTETSNYGCVSSINQNVTAYPKPVVNFSANAVCQLQANVFNNTSTIANGSISTWAWDFTSDGVIDNNTQNPNYTYSQGGNFNCTLHATSNMGCVDSVTKPVTVYLNPIANFNSPSVCIGSGTQFTDVSTSQNGTINGWNWDYTSNGTFDNTTQNPSNTYPASGTYSVTLQVTSSLGCLSSTTHTITVNPNPTVLFVVNDACAGSNFSFANNSTISNGSIVQTTWNFGDGSNSSQVAPQHSYATSNTYNITLTETSNYGCVSTLSNTVVAYPKPVINFSANPVCELQASVFNNTSSIASGSISSYGWDFTTNASIDNTTQNPTNTYTQGGSFNCTLHATSDKGCVDSVTKAVVIYHNPVANFMAPSACSGLTMQFTDASTSQNGNITVWDWDFTSDGSIDNLSQNPSNVYANAGLILVTLQVQTNFGCMNIIKKPVRINATPLADFTVTHKMGCPDNMCVGMVNNSSIQGGIITNWLWNFGDNTTSAQNSPTHCFKSGTYNVGLVVTSDSGCTASFKINNAITVYPKPVAGFAYTHLIA
jgi:PKD repeat protein